MSEFNFKGVWIPAKVFTDPRLTHSDKFLFSLIHILTNERGCFATRETLSGYMTQSVRNTQYSIGRLCDLGFVRKDPDGTLWDIISSTLEGADKFTPVVKNSSLEGCKKVHPYSNELKNKINKRVKDELTIPFIASNPDLSKAWDGWIAHRRSRALSVSPSYQNKWDPVLAQWGAPKALQSIESSTLNGWQGLFEPKGVRAHAPKTGDDHAKGF